MMSAEERFKQLDEALKFTDDQKPKVKATPGRYADKNAGARNAPQDERRDKMRTIMADQDKKMKEILTPDQYTKYQEIAPCSRRRQEEGRRRKEG